MEFLALDKHLIWVLPLLILALGVAYWAFTQRRHAIALLTQHAENCHLKSNAGPIRRRILAGVLLAALILSLIAVLRPIGGTEISEHRRPAKNLVVLLDVSNSMNAVDAEGISRIEAAKLLLREFINKRPTDRIGLISFAGATFTESPVTLDRSILLSKVNQITPGDIPVGGTDIDSALREAQNLLTEEPPPGSAIIVLSDGDNVTGRQPKEVLTRLKKANIPVLAIAVGVDGVGAPIPSTSLTTRADFSTLENLADSTNGLLIAASPREVDAQVQELSSRVDAIELNGENIAAEIFERPLDLYAWPLSIALLCLMIHLFLPLRTKVWRPLSAAFALSLSIFLPPSTHAQVADSYEEALAAAKEAELPVLAIFTGSDWSKLSITFEREILSHQVFQNWADEKVIRTIIDLPRVGLDAEERNTRRALAQKLGVISYPLAIFIDPQGNTLGTLTHDTQGPASWIKRAEAILAGEEGASDTAASVDYLPEEIRKALQADDLSPAQRSVGFYNKALELERATPSLSLKSEDRFELLIDLYNRAADAAPSERSDLIFAARLKIALLHHRKGQSLIPNSPEDFQAKMAEEQLSPPDLLKKAKRSLQEALNLYKNSVPLKPNDEELSENLALAYQNRDRIQAYLDYLTAYQSAVQKTNTALQQEKRFADSIEREVTTRIEVNKEAIEASLSAIQDLIKKAEAITNTPTILPENGLDDYRLADEDIALAPSPHRERDLRTAQQHIQNALDHLVDPQLQRAGDQGEGEGQAQDGQGEGQGNGEDEGKGENGKDEGKGKGSRQRREDADNPQGDKPDGSDSEPNGNEPGEGGDQGDAESNLRRAEKENGDLRDRLMDRLRRENLRRGKRVPRSKNH